MSNNGENSHTAWVIFIFSTFIVIFIYILGNDPIKQLTGRNPLEPKITPTLMHVDVPYKANSPVEQELNSQLLATVSNKPTILPTFTIETANPTPYTLHENFPARAQKHLDLEAGEIVIGTADRFQEYVEDQGSPFTAFLIAGPISIDLDIWIGGWDFYGNISETYEVEGLLAQKVIEIINNHPNDWVTRGINIVRLPDNGTGLQEELVRMPVHLEDIEVWGNLDKGVVWASFVTGTLIFHYEDGAYSPFPTDEGCDLQGCWKSMIFIYKNYLIDQIFDNSSKGEPKNPHVSIGWQGWETSEQIVIQKSKMLEDRQLEVSLGDSITLLPVDMRDAYHFPAENRGMVKISIWMK